MEQVFVTRSTDASAGDHRLSTEQQVGGVGCGERWDELGFVTCSTDASAGDRRLSTEQQVGVEGLCLFVVI